MSETTADINSAQQDVIDEFSFFDDWMDKYQHIIDLGRKLPDFPEDWQTDKYKIHGCQSQVWIRPDRQNGRLHFDATSDSAIVCGLIALLLRVYSDRTPDEILDTPPDFIGDIGLVEHLSPTRSNGLHAMLKQIFAVAEAAKAGEGA
jgi:cysteine desulfuration protein SufE